LKQEFLQLYGICDVFLEALTVTGLHFKKQKHGAVNLMVNATPFLMVLFEEIQTKFCSCCIKSKPSKLQKTDLFS